VKIIGLVPVRNEAWVLPHSLASLSGFCDIIIVSDQNSDDGSREICRHFPKVVLLESAESRISTQVRWQLFDAARGYDGCNLMWCTDADELVAPAAARGFFAARRDDLKPGTIVECMFVHPWHSPSRYREYHWGYAPQFKALAFVDDRRMDYDRSRPNSIHEPRVPIDSARGVLRAGELHVLHLQWLLAGRTQMRQAWYRCRELLDGRPARAINEDYATTLPDPDPAVLGLLVAPHPLRRTLGLKRFDSTSQRFGGTRRHTRYLAWTADVEIRDGAIHCPVPFTDLPLLSAAAPSVPPPMPDQADAP